MIAKLCTAALGYVGVTKVHEVGYGEADVKSSEDETNYYMAVREPRDNVV